jgi:hypothetical protein
MSQEIIAVLKEKPDATVAELPGAQKWFCNTYGVVITLIPDQLFVEQILDLLRSRKITSDANVCYWNPHEEGYDDGPGAEAVNDNWHTRERVFTGQYRGVIVEDAKDQLHAIITAAYENDDDISDLLEEEWYPPVDAAERDKLALEEIGYQVTRLSPAAKALLAAELTRQTAGQ